MKIKNLFIIIAFLASAPAFLFGQYQNADAVYENLHETYSLDQDGNISYHFYKKAKLNTHYSFNRMYGETFIVYNPDYQELIINKAQTIMADGKVVPVPENAFNEVLPHFAAGAPPFNQIKEMVITHTALEIGATIELDYVIKTKAGYFPALMDYKNFESRSPVREYVCTVEVPEGHEFHHRMSNLRLAPEKNTEKGKDKYIWRISNLHQLSGEDHLPPKSMYLPCLTFSTAKNLQIVTEKLTAQKAFTNQKLPQSAIDFAHNLKTQFSNKTQLMQAIRKHVDQNINNWFVPLQYTAYKARTISEVWNSNGGTKLEKNLLLSALLREAGFRTNVVATIPQRLYEPAIGCLDIIDDYAVECKFDNKSFVISATHNYANNMQIVYPDKEFLVLDPAIESLLTLKLPHDKSLQASLNMNMKLVLNEGAGFSGKGNLQASLYLVDYFNWQDKGAKEARGMIKGFVQKNDIKDFVSKTFEEKEMVADFVIESEKNLEDKEGYLMLALPVWKDGIDSRNISALPSIRKEPLYCGKAIDESYSFEIEVPKGYRVLNEDVNIRKMKSFGSLEIKISHQNNKIIIKRQIKINDEEIRPADYEVFRIFMNEWNNEKYRNLILNK